MIQAEKQPIKVAILDLYDGVANEGMRGFREILARYREKNNLNLTVEEFDVRGKTKVPGTDFDIYIFSGGPGSPIDSEGSEWERKFFQLVDNLEDHNLSISTQKKYSFYVCHSFQLMCRQYGLGDVNLRKSASFGVLPIPLTSAGLTEPVFDGLADPFYSVDSRRWQVVNPHENRFAELGMQLLAIEKERPHVDLPRAMMAIRFNEYAIGTQFHPEADAMGVKTLLLQDDEKQDVIEEHGIKKYNAMLLQLDDPDKITLTQNTIIPNFLDQAVLSLQEI
ncbi:MAG: GMP synthase [Bacteroidota bacterium]|nr:GMP synthase [Bacteroidota bacterium]